MKSIGLKMTLLVALLFACTTAWSTTPTNWEKLRDKVVRDGYPIEYDHFTFLVLEDTQPADKNLDHTSYYLSAMGGFDPNNIYHVLSYRAVVEYWVTDKDGHWDVDQWMFEVDTEGRIIEVASSTGRSLKAYHYRLRKMKSGTVIDSTNYGASNEELEARWQQYKAFWEAKVK